MPWYKAMCINRQDCGHKHEASLEIIIIIKKIKKKKQGKLNQNRKEF
jgi:hypothetical protein